MHNDDDLTDDELVSFDEDIWDEEAEANVAI